VFGDSPDRANRSTAIKRFKTIECFITVRFATSNSRAGGLR